MSRLLHVCGLLCSVVLAPAASTQQGPRIAQTKHNLSISGPGEYRAVSEPRICIFCHAPHKATPQAPLWNREDSRTTYLTYESPTFEGAIDQPNGTTKLCLSCHDGTVALGKIVSSKSEIVMAGGQRFLTRGPGYVGSNLRDDHPVSFRYSASRGGSDPDFLPAPTENRGVRLDPDGYVQCTSCHDPHNNAHGYFLHETDFQSQICRSCHAPRDWVNSVHASSVATWNGLDEDPWPNARYENVRDNGCANCHRQHGAGRPQHLLNFADMDENCLRCHNGNVARHDIARDREKPSSHMSAMAADGSEQMLGSRSSRQHAACKDCHNSHQIRSTKDGTTGLPGSLHGIDGVSSSGSEVESITYGFEVCYKCHADDHGSVIHVPRAIQQANTRLEFDPGNPSFHPIEAPGRSTDVPSLLPPWTPSSQMTCWDCHSSNTSQDFGGNGPRGPHGSIYRGLLGAKNNVTDGTAESSIEYGLCYRCHNRSSILRDESFKEHRKHIVDERAPCSVCHDPHGISSSQGNAMNNSHLINFDISVVAPSVANPGVLEFVDRGSRRGSCTLTCHGHDHDNLGY